MNAKRFEAEVRFEARHWNFNAACWIPDAWVAYVFDTMSEEMAPKWPCGKTREEAVAAVVKEYGDACVFL